MNNIFSQDLINRTIEYFKEHHNHHITEEQAIEYLNAFSGLFEAFADFLREQEK